jgi:hypothetical protein
MKTETKGKKKKKLNTCDRTPPPEKARPLGGGLRGGCGEGAGMATGDGGEMGMADGGRMVTDGRRDPAVTDGGRPMAQTQSPEMKAHGGVEGGRSQGGVEADVQLGTTDGGGAD